MGVPIRDGSDRSDFTGTNNILPPPAETRGATVTKTSTRERVVLSTLTSWLEPKPTDNEGVPERLPELLTMTVSVQEPPSFQPVPTEPAAVSVETVTAPPVVIVVGTVLSSVQSRPSMETIQTSSSSPSQYANTNTLILPTTITTSTTGNSSTASPTSNRGIIPLVVATTSRTANKGSGGGIKVSPAVIGGICAAVGVVIISALAIAIAFYRRRRRQRKVGSGGQSTSRGLKQKIGGPTFPKHFSEGSTQPMISARDSEAMLLSRTCSAGTQASSWSAPVAAGNSIPTAANSAPPHPASQSPAFTPGHGYGPLSAPTHYDVIPTIVEPPATSTAAAAVRKPQVRPSSSYYPVHDGPPHAQRLDDPFRTYTASAYRDAGNPYTTPIKPVAQVGLTVPKSSHQSERVGSVFSAATAAVDDSASYYSGWFNEEQGRIGSVGSGGDRINSEALYGSIMAQCAAATPQRPKRETVEGEGEWYSGSGSRAPGRDLTGYGR